MTTRRKTDETGASSTCQSDRELNYRHVYEAIYRKLVADTELREERRRADRRDHKPAEDSWILAERECVLREVNRQRGFRGYPPVDIAAVERAERTAVGHSDYVSKYAHAAADLVLRKEPFS